MENTFLDPSEIQSLTERVRRSAQVKVLRAIGIEHKVRPDGSVAILRAHILKVFGGDAAASMGRKQKPHGPNWAAI